MHEHQRNPRFSAAKAFMESLDQLQNILAQERQTDESEPSDNWSDSEVLEEVGADLDEFFGEQEPSEAGLVGDES